MIENFRDNTEVIEFLGFEKKITLKEIEHFLLESKNFVFNKIRTYKIFKNRI
jgi:hypothetical protein